MKPMRYLSCSVLALAGFAFAGDAFATPVANSVVVVTRIFNDCPTSNLIVTDNDFAQITLDESNLDNPFNRYANRHAWSFSSDNTNAIDFQNSDGISYCATVMANGSGNGELGLRLSPWWALDVDGVFMLNTRSGEIACFGGRLPFYSFTSAHGQTYVKGTAVLMSITYRPNGLSAISPGTVEFRLTNGNGTFSSGQLAFDQGNAAQDPPHGQWGILQPARAGGWMQSILPPEGFPAVDFRGEWVNICYDALPVPAAPSTWGRLKADYR